MKIAVLSDTHDTLPAGIGKLLAGIDLILHAGDMTDARTLNTLERLAPVIAVRGNCDQGVLATLPERISIRRDGENILIIHNLNHLPADSIPEETTLVIFGHTHVPVLTSHHGRRYLNPGSLSSPRGGSEPSFALIDTGKEPADITHIRNS